MSRIFKLRDDYEEESGLILNGNIRKYSRYLESKNFRLEDDLFLYKNLFKVLLGLNLGYLGYKLFMWVTFL